MNDHHRPLAAVAYLNMLPFFADNPALELYSKPTELNRDLTSGMLTAGCSSVLAGLEAGLETLTPLKGVAAENFVESVFIEALIKNEEDRDQWGMIRNNNLKSLFWDENFCAPIFPPVECSSKLVTIYSTGASAQSHWIVRTLLEAQGFQVETLILSAELEKASSEDLSRFWCGQQRPGIACLLSIGDPALERRLLFPTLGKIIRFDVAELWKEATGTPCIFALWYRSNLPEEIEPCANSIIQDSLDRWRRRSEQSKIESATAFLQKNGKKSLANLLGPAGILSYLGNLNYSLDYPAFETSLVVMRALHAAQTTFRARKFVSSSRSTVSRMRFL